MIQTSFVETGPNGRDQYIPVVINPIGKNKHGGDVPLDGPIRVVPDEPNENFLRAEVDPADPTGFTAKFTSTITEQTPGVGPWLSTGNVFVDARPGSEVREIAIPYAIEITASQDAVNITATVGTPAEVGTTPPPGPAGARKPGR